MRGLSGYGAGTVTAQVLVKEPSTVVAVTVEVPCATAVTTPAELTVATAGLLDAHVTEVLVASAGATVAVSVLVFPIWRLIVAWLSVTPVTEIRPL